jgi:hypothetical protein
MRRGMAVIPLLLALTAGRSHWSIVVTLQAYK